MTAAETWSQQLSTGQAATGMIPYESIMVPRLFVPWAELLLDRLELVPGLAVLDVACGPGTVARLAAARVGSYGAVTACDLSPPMLDIARAEPPVEGGAAIECLECPADDLAVADRSFDVITCQHGLQFFPDKAGALAEMRRAGRLGARLGLAVWTTIDESPAFAAVARVLERILGPEVAATYRGGAWGLPDRAALKALVEAAGFSHIDVQRESLPMAFEGGPAQIMGSLAITAVAGRVAELDERGRADLADVAEEELGPLVVGGVLRAENAAHVLLATV